MKLPFRVLFKLLPILILILLTGIGCTTPQSPPPTDDSSSVNLDAHHNTVKLIRQGGAESELEEAANAGVQVEDRIQLNETGQGLIRFLDRIDVGLHQATEVRLEEANQDVEDSVSLNLYQSYGNTHVQLSEQPNTWITLRTDYVTVSNLEEGADFVICHKPETITCGVVLKGTVAFVAEGRREIAAEGEAIYVRPGEPPSPPICARMDEVNNWLQTVQTSEPVQGLGAIVGAWPQEPCPGAAQGTPIPEGADLPSPDRMVMIQAGVYTIGHPQTDEFHAAQQEIPLNQFWIDQYEVTNAQYQEFLEDSGHQPPAVWPGEDDHPVRGLAWGDAAAYCEWANKRLPTEAQWEAAARGQGSEPRLYPWGDDPQADGQVSELPLDGTYPVGAFPFNQSPAGVYDQAGNVWEWVGDPYASVPEGTYVLRGGRFGLPRDAAFRQAAEPGHERFVPFSGFRCAADQVLGE